MIRWLLITGSLVWLMGCGPQRPKMGQVRGSITLDGQLVAAGTIEFWPEAGRPSRASIDEGQYTLTTFDRNDGALVGDHIVTIKSTQLTQPEPEISSTQQEIDHFRNKNAKIVRASEVKWVVPELYSNRSTTTLRAHVESGTNEIDFNLESN